MNSILHILENKYLLNKCIKYVEKSDIKLKCSFCYTLLKNMKRYEVYINDNPTDYFCLECFLNFEDDRSYYFSQHGIYDDDNFTLVINGECFEY